MKNLSNAYKKDYLKNNKLKEILNFYILLKLFFSIGKK